MNDDTVVAVFGYYGDAHQIKMHMPYYLHHKRPVVVLSPVDAPVTSKQVSPIREIIYRTAGRRAYVGQDSLDRQISHLKILLEYPARYYLLNDSDSVCLSPEIPLYLYRELPAVWSNVVSDEMHPRPEGYTLPRLAFQPPYFLRRQHIEEILRVAPAVVADPRTPFIDWAMMSWTIAAKLPYKSFYDGVSCPSDDANPAAQDAMSNAVRREGRIMIHSVKTPHMLLRLAYDRLFYKKTHGLK